MNEIFTKAKEDRFIAVNDETLFRLNNLNCLVCWTLYFYLAQKQTFQNGLVGVFSEIKLANLQEQISKKKSYDITTTKHYQKKLEKAGLIKVLCKSPLLISLPTAESAEHFDDLAQALAYVQKNEKEFQFHQHASRARAFYASHCIAPALALQDSQGQQAKATALDLVVKARPSRINTPDELAAAEDFARMCEEDDPFSDHYNKNRGQKI